MSFRITGLDAKPFRHLYGLSESELAAHGAIRYVAESKPGYPDRVEMRDVEPGESVLLVNYAHQPADSPYRSSHAIFVREGAQEPYDRVGEVPQCLRVRPLSREAPRPSVAPPRPQRHRRLGHHPGGAVRSVGA